MPKQKQQPIGKFRHWKQRWDPRARLVWRKRFQLLRDVWVNPGDPVTKKQRESLGDARLHRWWDSKVIEIRAWQDPAQAEAERRRQEANAEAEIRQAEVEAEIRQAEDNAEAEAEIRQAEANAEVEAEIRQAEAIDESKTDSPNSDKKD